jgi:broad specificity phosphatase PhoE
MAGTVLLIPHMDAGVRGAWSRDQNHRPLSELGVRQAKALTVALSPLPIVRLYASPTLRAQQTLEPLSLNLGQKIELEAGLVEKQLGEDTAALAERGCATLRRIARPDGLVAAASHGDLIPAVIAKLTRDLGLAPVPTITQRGQWYVIKLSESPGPTIQLEPGPSGFPR